MSDREPSQYIALLDRLCHILLNRDSYPENTRKLDSDLVWIIRTLREQKEREDEYQSSLSALISERDAALSHASHAEALLREERDMIELRRLLLYWIAESDKRGTRIQQLESLEPVLAHTEHVADACASVLRTIEFGCELHEGSDQDEVIYSCCPSCGHWIQPDGTREHDDSCILSAALALHDRTATEEQRTLLHRNLEENKEQNQVIQRSDIIDSLIAERNTLRSHVEALKQTVQNLLEAEEDECDLDHQENPPSTSPSSIIYVTSS